MQKNVTLTSEDLRVDRKAVVKVIIIDSVNNPAVVKIETSLFAIPNEQRDTWEYEDQVERIRKKCKKELGWYIHNNKDVFFDKYILDMNLTAANLKKDYNKSVTISLYARQRDPEKFSKTKKYIKESIKTAINNIIDKIREEDFKCYKHRQKINCR